LTIAMLLMITSFSTSLALGQQKNRKQQKLEKIATSLGVTPMDRDRPYNNKPDNNKPDNNRPNNNKPDNNKPDNNRPDNNKPDNNKLDNKDPLAKAYTAEERIKANTAGNTKLSDEEKKLIFYCNLARLDGKKFAETILKPCLDGKSNQYIKSLYSELQSVKNLPMLTPEGILCQVCANHCVDMDKNSFYAHNSSDGTDPFVRMENSGYKGKQRAENVSAGYKNAINICLQLLVDDGVPSLAHRKSILGSKYKVIGVAITKHKKWKWCCTMDLGDVCYRKMQ